MDHRTFATLNVRRTRPTIVICGMPEYGVRAGKDSLVAGAAVEGPPRLGPEQVEFILKGVDAAFQLVECHAIRRQTKNAARIRHGARQHDRDASGHRLGGWLDVQGEGSRRL